PSRSICITSTPNPPVGRDPRNTPTTVDFVKSTARSAWFDDGGFDGLAFHTALNSDALCRTTSLAFSTPLYWPRSSVGNFTGSAETTAADRTAAATTVHSVDTFTVFRIPHSAFGSTHSALTHSRAAPAAREPVSHLLCARPEEKAIGRAGRDPRQTVERG